jgi:glucosylceramidase
MNDREQGRLLRGHGTIARFLGGVLLAALLFVSCANPAPRPVISQASPPFSTATLGGGPVSIWLTTPDTRFLLSNQPGIAFQPDSGACTALVLCVDSTTRYQHIVGFGASLTDTSAYLIAHSTPENQATLMRAVFDPVQGIGISFLRQPVGSSDFSAQPYWTYDDVPSSACPAPHMTSDPTLLCFSLSKDLALPLLQEALQLNPQITVMATPWSPPAWMKTTQSLVGENNSVGGTLRQDSINGISVYQSYAQYFVKFLQAYQAAGIPVTLLTVQNEPGAHLVHNPGMDFRPDEQIDFIEHALVPALQQAHLHPGILVYDSNYDHNNPKYPYQAFYEAFRAIPASDYLITGTSVHCYGAPSDLMPLPTPEQVIGDLYETECSPSLLTSVYAVRPANPLAPIDLVIDGTRDGARTIVLWNIAENQQRGPRPQGDKGCPCTPLITVETGPDGLPTGKITYNPEFYTLGHASKFVLPGAYRIFSSSLEQQGVKNVAFLNPNGSIVLIAHNTTTAPQTFKVLWDKQSFQETLPAGAVVTLQWAGG